MSGSVPADVRLEPRLGPRASSRRQRVTIGSDVPIWTDVVSILTGALVPGATGASAIYWAPGTAGDEAAAQPLDVTEITPGTLHVRVPGDEPGTYLMRIEIDTPTRAAAEIVFDRSSLGDVTLTSAGTIPWGDVQAVAAAAAVSAARPEARAVARAEGAASAAPYAETAQEAAQSASQDRAIAEQERQRATAAADTTAATVANAAVQRETLAELVTAMADAAEDAQGIVYGLNGDEGVYRKRAGSLVRVSDTQRQIQARVEAVPMRSAPAFAQFAEALTDDEGNVARALSMDGQLQQWLFATLRGLLDGTVRLERRDGAQGIELRADGVALPGMTAGSVSATGVDFALTDEGGLFAFLKRFTGGGAWLEGLTVQTLNGVTSLTSADGSAFLRARPDGGFEIAGLDTYQVSSRTDLAVAYADAEGFLGFALKPDGTALGTGFGGTTPSPIATTYSAEEIATRTARALVLSMHVRGTINTTVAGVVWNYNHVIGFGQSLSIGQEGWPALSKTARRGNLMIGDAVRGTTVTAVGSWAPFGSAAFQPMIARNTNNTAFLTDAAVAALAPGNLALGESPLEGAVNFLKALNDQHRGVIDDPEHLLVVSSTGVGGQTVAQLSKGATPELFQRPRDCVAIARGIVPAGKTYGVPAIIYLQGEADYSAGTAKATYKAATAQLFADLRSDVLSFQQEGAGIFIYQTRSTGSSDSTGLAVGMSQLELSNELPDVIMVGPHYPVTDKGTHLDGNGYRWLGMQFGKVMHRVLMRREGWKPLQPIRITRRGRQVLVDFHVPEPPLAFGLPYVGTTATDIADKGFTYTVGGAAVGISSVAIVGDASVLITLVSVPSGGAEILRYADNAHGGSGCLRDSDATTAADVYAYTAGSGQYPEANIPALVGNPYPLHNWCVAFAMPVVAD